MATWMLGPLNDDNYEQYIRNFYASFTHLKINKSSIPGAGLGVFANGFIARGTAITHFPGRLVNMYKNVHYPMEYTLHKLHPDYDKVKMLYVDPFVPGTDLSIGCGHLINSSHPALKLKKNCDFYSNQEHPWITVFASEDIPDGKELLADYHHMLTYRMKLKCKCRRCRAEKYDALVQFQRTRKGASAPPKEILASSVSREHLNRRCQSFKRKFDLAFV